MAPVTTRTPARAAKPSRCYDRTAVSAYVERPSPSLQPLLTALSLSLLVHGALIAWSVATPMRAAWIATGAAPDRIVILESDAPPPLPEPLRPPAADRVSPPPPPRVDPTRPMPPLAVREPEELHLGIDDGDDRSVNWIGYKDYLEHFAPLAETEQAARRLDAAGAEGRAIKPAPPGMPSDAATPAMAASPSLPPVPATPPAPTLTPAEAAKEVLKHEGPTAPNREANEHPANDPKATPNEAPNAKPAPAATPPAPDPHDAPTKPAAPPMPPQTPVTPVPSPATPLPAGPPTDPAAHPSDPSDLPPGDPSNPAPGPHPPSPPPTAPPESGPLPPAPSAPPTAEPVEGSKESTSSDKATQPAPPADAVPPAPDPTEPVQPTPPQPMTAPGSSAPANPATPGPKRSDNVGDGEVSDSESDPTSVVSVPPSVWKNGRPIAARGLNIKTRKPKFTVLTLVTTTPRNPVVEVKFDREGKPASYGFVTNSGFADIDGPILDAIAGWRASGKPLEKLKNKDTIAVRIKLVLVQ